VKPADLRRTLGGALLLIAGAGLWVWNATGDTRPALAPGAALVDSAASPEPAPTGLSLTPAPSTVLGRSAAPARHAAVTPHPAAPRHGTAKPAAAKPTAAKLAAAKPAAVMTAVAQQRPAQRPAPHPRVAAKPRPRRSAGRPIVARRYVQSAMKEQALRSARGLLAADGVNPADTALSATLVGRDTVRVSASQRADPSAPARVIVLKRTASGYTVLDAGTPAPAPASPEPVAASPTPDPAPRRGPHALFHHRDRAPQPPTPVPTFAPAAP
jgi:hypothetical protein